MAVGAISGPVVAECQEMVRTLDRYWKGGFLGAIRLLETADALDAEGLLLAGQAHYRAGNIRAACDFFERAVAAKPSDSGYVHWLGRAYGRRAENANVLLARLCGAQQPPIRATAWISGPSSPAIARRSSTTCFSTSIACICSARALAGGSCT